MKADMTVREANPTDQKLWNGVVSHPLQSWAWGDFRSATKIDVIRLAVSTNLRLNAGWQLTFHRIPLTPYTIGYFPKGPRPTGFMLSALDKIAREKRAIFIQLEPDVRKEKTQRLRYPDTQSSNPDFKTYVSGNPNLIPSHRPLFTKYTYILDLTKSEEELMSRMYPKTRYNLKVARKHGVKVSENNSKAAFEAYIKLSEITSQRQRFYAHDATYHQHLWQILNPAGLAKLWTATLNGELLAAWIIFEFKDTVYYPYGASSRSHREVMAPNLMLWEIALSAKRRGFKYFDLWGAIGPNPDPTDPWYGFHRFKEGYNPELVEFIGSFDFVIYPHLYRLYTLADSLRWKILRLIK